LRLELSEFVWTGAEGGFVVDRYQAVETCHAAGCGRWSWDKAVWGRIGVSLEARTRLGLTGRLAAGATSIFNTDSGHCESCAPGHAPGLWAYSLPYLSLSLGWVL
jgi:hypothetical protein